MLNPLTRNLLVMSVQRRLNKTVTLNESTKILQLNGSFDVTPNVSQVRAAVNDLSEKQKKLVREAGVSNVKGVMCEIIGEQTKPPDSVEIDGLKYNIFDYMMKQGISSYVLLEQTISDQS